MATGASAVLKPAQTWLGAPAGLPTRGTKAAIVGVPFDVGTHPTRIGSRLGPASIREQSVNLRRYDPHSDLDLLQVTGLVDCGDAVVVPSDIEGSFASIERALDAVLAGGAVAITMGGDGSVSLPQMRAAAKRHPGLCVVHLDAHTDAYPMQGFNTATTFRHAAQDGVIDVPRSFHIGVRGPTLVPGVIAFCRELGYNLVTMRDLRRDGIDAVVAAVRAAIGDRPAYLCFDMDFFDPSCAPGVCTPAWGGVTAQEGLDLVELLTRDLNVVLLDVNTVSPPHDAGGMTAFLAATVQWTALGALAVKVGGAGA
jgi:agmatinase